MSGRGNQGVGSRLHYAFFETKHQNTRIHLHVKFIMALMIL